MLEQSEVLTLDDNKEYCVVFSTTYNNDNYVFLIDQDDYTNTMFCKYDYNSGLEEVIDENIVEELMKKYIEFKNKN